MVPGERLITTTEVDNWPIDYERTTGPEPLYFKNKGGDAAGEENIIGHVFQPEHLYEDDTSDFRDKDVSKDSTKRTSQGRLACRTGL